MKPRFRARSPGRPAIAALGSLAGLVALAASASSCRKTEAPASSAGAAAPGLAAAPGGATPPAGGGAAAKRPFRIAMVGKGSTNPVFVSARTGAEARARELTAKLGRTIEVVWLTPPQEDGQIQAQRLAQAVNEGADAVLLSCSDAGKIAGAIDDAAARGVPVMTFDSDAPRSKRFAFYGVDDVKTGEAVMAELARMMNGKGKVAVLAGNQNAPNLRRRVDGVKAEAARHPEMKIVDTFFHIETPQDAAAEVIRVSHAYPEVTGWVMIGGWALFTTTLLRDLDPKKYKIASVDALPAELVYVEKGLVPVLLAQSTYLWGAIGVETIVNHVMLGKPVASEVIPMDLVRVTKENLGTWARQLHEWGFADVPEEYLKLP